MTCIVSRLDSDVNIEFGKEISDREGIQAQDGPAAPHDEDDDAEYKKNYLAILTGMQLASAAELARQGFQGSAQKKRRRLD